MIDHVVEAIRARRRRLMKETCGGSVSARVQAALKWQAEHPKRVVSRGTARSCRKVS